MLTVVLLLFALGGAVCALAGSIGVLIAGRVIQGVAGGVFPLAFGIMRDTFPPERVAAGLGLLSARSSASAAASACRCRASSSTTSTSRGCSGSA